MHAVLVSHRVGQRARGSSSLSRPPYIKRASMLLKGCRNLAELLPSVCACVTWPLRSHVRGYAVVYIVRIISRVIEAKAASLVARLFRFVCLRLPSTRKLRYSDYRDGEGKLSSLTNIIVYTWSCNSRIITLCEKNPHYKEVAWNFFERDRKEKEIRARRVNTSNLHFFFRSCRARERSLRASLYQRDRNRELNRDK